MTPLSILLLVVLIVIATAITWIIFNPRRAKKIACTLLKVCIVVAVLVGPAACHDEPLMAGQRPVLLPIGQMKDMPQGAWGDWITWWMDNGTWPVPLNNSSVIA